MLGIIGPSGCGKTTILNQLYAEGLIYVNPTYTERPIREGEEELEHKFVTPGEFSGLERAGFFIKTIQAFGLEYRYGIPKLKEDKGKVSVVMLRAMLVPMLFEYYPHSIVYQIEAPFSTARKWLKKRGDNELGSRVDDFHQEIEQGRKYASRVFINGADTDCLNEIKEALKADFSPGARRE